jgi:hypothetical protein
MNRRDFLRTSGILSGHLILTSGLSVSAWIENAHGAEISVEGLRKSLDPKSAYVLLAQDRGFSQYQPAFNTRTLRTPLVRVLCLNAEAVVTCLAWAQTNNVPLAMRAGGHSYEGFSQSTGLVIDTRLMRSIDVSSDASEISIGAGVLLGDVYSALGPRGRTIPAGTCPTVGATGHTSGGGYGLLARAYGLACDSLEEIEIVTADGKEIRASENENSDLFWGFRGAGNGNFGVVTKLKYQTHPVDKVLAFSMDWSTHQSSATQLLQAWQQWMPTAPNEITSLFKISKDFFNYNIRCIGQSIGDEQTLRRELAQLTRVASPAHFNVQALSYLDSVRHFGGSDTSAPAVYMKAKSDYVMSVMDSPTLQSFTANMPTKNISVILDGYGGAIRNLKDTDTAFAHRENSVCSIQYYTQWSKSEDTPDRLKMMRDYYNSLRPHFTGAAYVNYPDVDLLNYARSYWGNNLERLVQLKGKWDPNNFFRHAQSIQLQLK